jgi:Uma2 family endonuclease
MTDMTHQRMTAQEFAELPESNLPAELIEGELIMTPAPDDPHQKVAIHGVAVLLNMKLEGEIRFSPIDVYLDDENVLQPDIMWVSKDNPRCKLVEGRRWHGAPDLVIEILSPSTARRDKTVKFDLYERYGVREYWMLDYLAEYLEVYGLQDGRFVKIGIFGPEETFTSPVLSGKTVEVGALFGKS